MYLQRSYTNICGRSLQIKYLNAFKFVLRLKYAPEQAPPLPRLSSPGKLHKWCWTEFDSRASECQIPAKQNNSNNVK